MDVYFVLTMNGKARYRDTHDRDTFSIVSTSQERQTGIDDMCVQMDPKEEGS